MISQWWTKEEEQEYTLQSILEHSYGNAGRGKAGQAPNVARANTSYDHFVLPVDVLESTTLGCSQATLQNSSMEIEASLLLPSSSSIVNSPHLKASRMTAVYEEKEGSAVNEMVSSEVSLLDEEAKVR